MVGKLLGVCLCRTTSNLVANQAKQCDEATAALGAPPADGAATGDAFTAGVEGDANNIPEATRNYKELPPSSKPTVKYTKKARDRDEIQLKILELLSNDPMSGPSNKKII